MRTFSLLGIIILIATLLRFYSLSTNPPGLYIDEVSIGHNAERILTTGHDEHGIHLPLWFEAFGEYKMPVYIYLTSIAILLFGSTEFAVRFPSTVTGVITVVLFFFLLRNLHAVEKKIFQKLDRDVFALLGTFFFAINPWHIHFSRGGFEVTVAVFLYVLGLYLFVKHIRVNKSRYIYFSILCFVLTMYTYQAFRIIAPLTVIGIIYYLSHYLNQRRQSMISVLITILLSLPVIIFSVSSAGTTRFLQTSAFGEYTDLSLVEKIAIYPLIYLKNYVSHFSFVFLFTQGDGFARHGIPGFGLFPKWQLPLLIFGILYIIKYQRGKVMYFLLFLLFIIPIPAALTRPSPHALRTLLLVVPLTLLITFGIMYLVGQKRKLYKVLLAGLLLFALYETLLYGHYYFHHYPKTTQLEWGGMNKQVVEKARVYAKRYPIIVNLQSGLGKSHFGFYNAGFQPTFVMPAWFNKPEIKDRRAVLISPETKETKKYQKIDTVHLTNLNKDVFVNFYMIYDR
jgi:4-amino-4-deoxy-L-arabinose transferase-like glycosyltransferase